MKRLKTQKGCSESIIDALRLMLRFTELERPSFIELDKMIQASEERPKKLLIDPAVLEKFAQTKASTAKLKL